MRYCTQEVWHLGGARMGTQGTAGIFLWVPAPPSPNFLLMLFPSPLVHENTHIHGSVSLASPSSQGLQDSPGCTGLCPTPVLSGVLHTRPRGTPQMK